MARDRRPMTDDELAELREAMRSQREDIRDYLKSEGVDVSTWSIPADTDSDRGRGTAQTD